MVSFQARRVPHVQRADPRAVHAWAWGGAAGSLVAGSVQTRARDWAAWSKWYVMAARTSSRSPLRSATTSGVCRSAMARRSRTGRRDRDVGAQEWLQGPPDALERGVAREVHDVAVEGRVGGGLHEGVACLRRLPHLLDVALQDVQVRLRDRGKGEFRPLCLQDGAHLEGLQELLDAGVAHPGATEGRDLHDPERLEVAQGLPDGRLAGPELPGHAGLHDARAGRVAAVKDRLQEATLDLVAEDAPGDGGLVGHDAGRRSTSRGSRPRRRCRRRGSDHRS